MVVLIAVRVFTGTEGYKRRAVHVRTNIINRITILTLFHNVLKILHITQIRPVQGVAITFELNNLCS